MEALEQETELLVTEPCPYPWGRPDRSGLPAVVDKHQLTKGNDMTATGLVDLTRQ